MILIDPKALDVEATVVEKDFPLVQEGQAVQLYFDALPDAEVTGKRGRISWKGVISAPSPSKTASLKQLGWRFQKNGRPEKPLRSVHFVVGL
jgi:hypothetical protein